MRSQALRRFSGNRDGATIVEFAIVAPVFFLLLLGILEYGLYMFHKIAIESIVMKAGREATLGRSGNPCSEANQKADRAQYVRCYILDKTKALINGDKVTIQVVPLSTTSTTVPDICLFNGGKPVDPPASLPSCDGQYEDVNPKTGYQAPEASAESSGGQIVEVRVNYPWRVTIPLMSEFMGQNDKDNPGQRTGVVMITSSTIVKNEPF